MAEPTTYQFLAGENLALVSKDFVQDVVCDKMRTSAIQFGMPELAKYNVTVNREIIDMSTILAGHIHSALVITFAPKAAKQVHRAVFTFFESIFKRSQVIKETYHKKLNKVAYKTYLLQL